MSVSPEHSGGSRFKQISADVEVASTAIVIVNEALIDQTIDRARSAPKRRARVLLHPNIDDALHEMLIALPRESCDIPHINFKSGKSFHVVRGEMAVMVFTPDGKQVTPFLMGDSASSWERMIRINQPCWHTIIPLSEYVVFIETIAGPFTGNRFALWAPTSIDHDAMMPFAVKLREIARRKCSGIV